MKKFSIIFLSTLTVLFFSACNNNYPTTIPVTGIALRSGKTAISVENRGTRQIGAYVVPENATNKNLTYSSDDEMIASVNDEGLITTHNEGTVNITITAVDNPAVSKQVTLTVTKAIVRVTSIEFNPPLPAEPIEMFLNEMYKFDAKAMPEEAENRKLKFDTSNFRVAWVEDIHKGWIRADGEGEATVTIIADDNPFIKREVRFKMIRKPAGSSISIETPPNIETLSVLCESDEGDVSFTVKTTNGKLAYTPEVVGGGKEWVTSVRKDNTD
ncbi:MAG: Ig domain-containing protein, partial [Treponema sp.]|uniref:Ig-like domain-containing protein n=1 Tax=Treponema sp. TaxID=166 RepID=UPI00361A9153